MSQTVYKIIARKEWLAAEKSGAYRGSADDLRDGFVHLSTAAQLPGTAQKHFRGQSDLLLIAFEAETLGSELKWEPSRGGALFPHLYAALPVSAACLIHELDNDADGVPIIPQGLA